MKAATSPHSRYHYSNSLEEEQKENTKNTKTNTKNTKNTNTNIKQEIPIQVIAKETSKKESK